MAVRGEDVWARTYYRNTVGAPLDAALSLLGPDGHSVRSRCVAGAGDGPSLCETPRVRLKGEPLRHTAVAEFAVHTSGAEVGRLLPRAGSTPPAGKGAVRRARACAGAPGRPGAGDPERPATEVRGEGTPRARKDPVAGDGGCTSNRATGTVTRDRR